MFASAIIVRIVTPLAVIQRNVGCVGIIRVLQRLGVRQNVIAERSLERIDRTREADYTRKQTVAHECRRQELRGIKKRLLDKQQEEEEPSYEAGGFDVPGEEAGPSLAAKPARKRKAWKTPAKPPVRKQAKPVSDSDDEWQ